MLYQGGRTENNNDNNYDNQTPSLTVSTAGGDGGVRCPLQVFWVGPVTGALLAGMCYQSVFDQGSLAAAACEITNTGSLSAARELEDITLLDSDCAKVAGD